MPIKPKQRISPQTEFKPGSVPTNKLPVGSITVRTHRGDSSRYWIKISEPNQWIPNARFVWMQNGGTVPDGFVLHHLDGNTLNDDMSNLALVSRGHHVDIHRDKLQENKPSEIPLKDVTCSLCGEAYRGKAQRKNGLCLTCAIQERRKSRARYKARIRTGNG